VTTISLEKQNELVLLNGSPNAFLVSGLITASIVTVPIAVFLAAVYLSVPSLAYYAAAILVVFLLSFIAGYALRLEFRLIAANRITTSLPIFTSASFVVWGALFFILYLGNPDALGFKELLSAFFAFPLLITFAVSFLYSFVVHRVFFRTLSRRVSFDYIERFYREEFNDKLAATWDSVRRYSGKLSLLLVEFSYSHTANQQKGKPDHEAIEIMDKLSELVRKKIRGSDETGIKSENLIWVLLYRTSVEDAQVPKNRLFKEFEVSPELSVQRERNLLKVARSSLVEMTDDMKEPADLADKAVRELGAAAKF